MELLARTVVTKGKFAELKGCTPQCVSNWIKDGKITGAALVGDGHRARIWVERADADLARCLAPGQQAAQELPITLRRLAGGMFDEIEGWLPRLSAAIATKFGWPHRDVLHFLRAELKAMRVEVSARLQLVEADALPPVAQERGEVPPPWDQITRVCSQMRVKAAHQVATPLEPRQAPGSWVLPGPRQMRAAKRRPIASLTRFGKPKAEQAPPKEAPSCRVRMA